MTKMIAKPDSDVIQLLLENGDCTISDLESHLNVTATAVRQRLNRLMASGLVDWVTEGEGRGRPVHRYCVTADGRKALGNNLADFAGALWQEIQELTDQKIRSEIIQGAARRMAKTFSDQIQGDTPEERLNSVVTVFRDRDIPIAVEKNKDGLPILKILACPYPDLAKDNHELCEIERHVFSQASGCSFELCQCRQDGDSCCTFQTDLNNQTT